MAAALDRQRALKWAQNVQVTPAARTVLARLRHQQAGLPGGSSEARRCYPGSRTSPETGIALTPSRWMVCGDDKFQPAVTRPRGGCSWKSTGNALRICMGSPTEGRPAWLISDKRDCLEASSMIPDFSALGAHPLQPGLINRLTFEVRTEAASRNHPPQVGLAWLTDAAVVAAGLVEEELSVLADAPVVMFAGTGDVRSTGCMIEALLHRGAGYEYVQQMGDWCCGGPTWLAGEALSVRATLEVDFRRGLISLQVGDWPQEPAVIRVSRLAEEADGGSWWPCVALLAEGQQMRILDFHIVCS